MKIKGITGKSGIGKTTFASLLAEELKCKQNMSRMLNKISEKYIGGD